MSEKKEGKLELIAQKHFSPWDEMYLVVDFLNKHLKEKKVMFGLNKKNGEMVMSIYEVE